MTVKTDDKKVVEQKRSKAYNRAVKRLRDAHTEDWERFVAQEYAAEGLRYQPRLTPEQKAQHTIEELLSEFPDLRGKIAS